jgi:hypothetical protein
LLVIILALKFEHPLSFDGGDTWWKFNQCPNVIVNNGFNFLLHKMVASRIYKNNIPTQHWSLRVGKAQGIGIPQIKIHCSS